MNKGARVKVVTGKKAVGVTGTVFWLGANKWGEGKRAGVEGDDGETYWIATTHLEETGDALEIELPQKGTRVRFAFGEFAVEVEAEVFWAGPSKDGRGYRVGVKDGKGESHWIDARKVTPVSARATDSDEDPSF